jgi:hypothetical protein
MTHEAGVAPAWLGSLRQIFVGASPAELFTAHKEGLAHIERAGLAVREVAPEELMPGLLQSFRLQRSVFTRAPVRNVFRALVRTLTRRNPHLGPLADQAIAETQLRALRDGLWPPR